ncbi:S8 family serine peptidase [Saccharopolyspora sp. NPDC002686]|uniref:S8 family serine peptidase n=1 Tax=Saccharopolyspora sp. NPDC002686 TaxID=3154541 RepID=UPI0033187D31
MCELSAIPGLADLQKRTIGDERIRVAVLDSPVDLEHPVFADAKVRQEAPFWSEDGAGSADEAHGTAVASVIFGGPDSAVPGVAPRCQGIVIPIFSAGHDTTSQLELARAVEFAVDAGAHLINISGGQLTESGAAEDVLAKAVRYCQDRGVLVLAAAGNDGCFCMHVPAALPSVIAIGAMDDAGRPMPMSNWGPAYQRHGLLAPGENVRCAVPGGDDTRRSGTSFATPIVTGVAALLLSRQLRAGRDPDPLELGAALLESADPCELDDPVACLRFLTGKLNVERAMSVMSTDETAVPAATGTEIDPQEDPPQACACGGHAEGGGCTCADAPADDRQAPETAVVGSQEVPDLDAVGAQRTLETEMPPIPSRSASRAPEVVPSAEKSHASPVYAIGTLGFDFGTEARRDSFKQQMRPRWAPGGTPVEISDRRIEEATIRQVRIKTSGGKHTITGGQLESGYLIDEQKKTSKGISGGSITQATFDSGEIKPDDVYPDHQMLANATITNANVSGATESIPIAANPYDPEQMLAHLVNRPDEAKALIWTLNVELTPIYSYEPSGPYAAEVYDEFILLLAGQLAADGHKIANVLNANRRFAHSLPRAPGGQGTVAHIERVALAGRLTGRTVKLMSGQTVPVVSAEQPRGVLGWDVSKLIDETINAAIRAARAQELSTATGASATDDAELKKQINDMLRDFLSRIYFDLRNLGTTSHDRALNAAATYAFQAVTALSGAAAEGKSLDTIDVEKSPFERLDSDSWDIKLRFFDPEDSKRAKRVWRYTIDVSDLVPVLVGEPRTWQEA